jgi:hypothetical protein
MERKEASSIDNIIQLFNNGSSTMEFEVQIRPMSLDGSKKDATKIDYNSVIEWLLLSGFTIQQVQGQDILRIVSRVGEQSTRIEIVGIDSIQYYCRHLKFGQPKIHTKQQIKTFEIPEYASKLTLSEEIPVLESNYPSILQNLPLGKKTFRFMNRVRLEHKDHPFIAFDCSIVKTSDDIDLLFNKHPTYEIEVEFKRTKDLKPHIIQAITFGLRGFQRSYFPIGATVMKRVLAEYEKMTSTTSLSMAKKFIGPSLVTLQHENLGTIQKNYYISEKADGERKLLFIVDKRVYLITSSMQIEYTGIQYDSTKFNNILLDGEHVVKKKSGESTNTYFAFDIYFCRLGKEIESVRHFPFVDDKMHRYDLLQQVIRKLVVRDSLFQLTYKEFIEFTPDAYKLIHSKQFDYHTDGLILVPKQFGVGMSETQTKVINEKFTWDLNFKWKPPEENSVDFYVQVSDSTYYSSSLLESVPYKILKLYVGFGPTDIKYNGKFLNHQYCIFHRYEIDRVDYGKIVFKPEGFPHIAVVKDPLKTELGEVIEDKMIIECRYDASLVGEADYARWVPMRVRWDKMKSGNPNAFTTALSNWSTIKHPITPELLSDPKQAIYYKQRTGERSALAIFHNKIKTELLKSFITPKCIMLDFAVGKGGDLRKWKGASFVVGIDLFDDNINNKLNGACQRYVEGYQESENPIKPMRCLFLQGDSTKNIKSGEACSTEYDKAVIRSIFGLDPKNANLGNGVVDHYEKSKRGFDVTTMQFAVHYMFKSITTLTEFLKNVAECTALNGHFIGTCYDGEKVFQLLKEHPKLIFKNEDETICTITKKYTATEHADNKSCLGYTIDVFQESIGSEIEEYLVFFTYFVKIMAEYGFELQFVKSFDAYYKEMGIKGRDMYEDEKRLSFLNNAFAFKKVKEIQCLPVKLHSILI